MTKLKQNFYSVELNLSPDWNGLISIYIKDEPVSANFNEQVKQTENDELVMALEAEGIEEIAQVNNALNRIEEGTYQSCAKCGEDISEERLEAIPYTDRCIDCAE